MNSVKYIFLLLFSTTFFAFSEGKATVGVAPVEVSKSVSAKGKLGMQDCLASLETNLEARFQQSGLFVVVDRKRLKDIRLEQDLNASGLVSDVQAKKYSLVGSKYIVFPKIDSYEAYNQVQNFPALERRDENVSVYMSVSAKIVDASTGVIFQSVPSIVIEDSQKVEKLRRDQKVVLSKLWSTVGRDAAQKLVERITTIVKPAKVLAKNGTQIMINRGSTTGFKVGKTVTIYATQKIIDEGETFLNEVAVGEAVVARGDERKCFAMLKGEDLGVTKDCIVKISNDETK